MQLLFVIPKRPLGKTVGVKFYVLFPQVLEGKATSWWIS